MSFTSGTFVIDCPDVLGHTPTLCWAEVGTDPLGQPVATLRVWGCEGSGDYEFRWQPWLWLRFNRLANTVEVVVDDAWEGVLLGPTFPLDDNDAELTSGDPSESTLITLVRNAASFLHPEPFRSYEQVGIDGVEVAAPTDHLEPWPAIDQVLA